LSPISGFNKNSVKLIMTLLPSESHILPEIPKGHCGYDLRAYT